MTSDIPLYKEIQRRILEALARGEWQPGERLPNEASLAKKFGVSVSTLRAGVGELTDAGVLVRRQGKGTFIAQHHRDGPQFRFSNIHNHLGRKVVATRQIISMRRTRADQRVTMLLGTDGNKPLQIHHIDAILKVDSKPVGAMELFLPVTVFPKIVKRDFESGNENLYSLYQSQYGITVLRMEERIFARTAKPEIARALGLKVGHPLLVVERIAYSFNNRAVEIRRRMYEAFEHHYLFTHESLD